MTWPALPNPDARWIGLGAEELERTITVGLKDYGHAVDNGIPNWGETGLATQNYVVGRIGQRGASLVLGCPEVGVGLLSHPDLANGVEVRSRLIKELHFQYDLAIRPIDERKRNSPFVLCWVNKKEGEIYLVGWLFGHEALGRKAVSRWDAIHKCWYITPPYRSVTSLIERWGRRRS